MTIRVGVIGTGNIGTSHARDLEFRVAGATVTALYDFDQPRAQVLAAELGAVAVPTFQDVIDSDQVDAVLIASPDQFHAEQAMCGLAAGKPMLCEKPLAPVEADAKAVVEAEAAGGRALIMMGFMRRFDPGYTALKASFGPGGIGDPLLIHNAHRNTSAPYGLNSELSLTNAVIHEFDINRWLLDEEYSTVTVLTGKSGPLTPEGQHDPLFVILRSSSGAIVDIEMFVNSQFGYEVTCQVSGSLGRAEMGDGSFVTRTQPFFIGKELPELWLGRFGEAYRLQLQGWISYLEQGGPMPGATAWDGYAATIVANRAIESLRSGAEVAVDLPARPALYA